MPGSTEHNMGRAVHNAYVYEWLVQRLMFYMKRAELEPDNSDLQTFRKIEVQSQTSVKAVPPPASLFDLL